MDRQKNKLNFRPLAGLSSPHLQTIISSYKSPGVPPPSTSWHVELDEKNILSCEVSIPVSWKEDNTTVALVHGLGGSHASCGIVRLSRKLYLRGFKVIRVNLRGCGTGKGLSSLPYSAGSSADILKVLQVLKKKSPTSEIILIGFSLGGNIVLKLIGELGEAAKDLVKTTIAVCAPLDLAQSVKIIQKKRHFFYHAYYLKAICRQAQPWLSKKVRTLYEFDDLVTGPCWGYKGADDYYQQCSSIQFLPKIQHNTHLIFAEDDPFVPLDILKDRSFSDQVHLWMTTYGGHMGFLGKVSKGEDCHWIDQVLLNWVAGNFSS